MSRRRKQELYIKDSRILVGWYCSCCNHHNVSEANIHYSDSNIAGAEYRRKKFILDAMVNPKQQLTEIRQRLFLNNSECVECKKREIWSKKFPMWPAVIPVVFVFLGSLTLCAAIGESIFAAIVGIGLILLAILSGKGLIKLEESITKRPIPEQSLPHIYCDEADIIQLAKDLKKNINTHKIKEYVLLEEPRSQNHERNGSAVLSEKGQDMKEGQAFCFKCGAKLKPHSEFCSFCGSDLR